MLELARFGPDPLRYLDGLRDDPRDLVPFTLGRLRCHLAASPALIDHVLSSEDYPPLSRGRIEALRVWYGGGLLLEEGAEHDRQRAEVWGPAIPRAQSAAIAVERTARRVEAWPEGEPVELFRELNSLCWSIDWQALTGGDLDAAPELLEAERRGVEAMLWLIGPFGRARWNLPLPATRRTKAAQRTLDGAIDALIAARRAEPRDDVLSILTASDDDDTLVRATVKQWLTADQVHAWLTWALDLLARHPDVESRWRAELDEVVGQRPATVDDVPALPYARSVLKETLRLYPPIWGFFRGLTGEYRLGSETLPAGDLIALSPWFTQRDPRYWPDPERFDPDRFAEGAPQPPAVSYFPFSTGPYGCNAYHLSTTVAVLVLTTIGQRWRLRADGPAPAPEAKNVVVPRGGLRLTPAAIS